MSASIRHCAITCALLPFAFTSGLLAQCDWQAVQVINSPVGGNNFGTGVAINASHLVLGAPNDGAAGANSGRLYTYTESSGSYLSTGTLTTPSLASDDRLGRSVAIEGNILVAGTDRDDGMGTNAGSAHVWTLSSSGNWIYTTELFGGQTVAGSRFGFDVDISDGRIFISAPEDLSGGVRTGAVYVFEFSAGAGWQQTERILASVGSSNDFFGHSIDADGERILIGAYGDDDVGNGGGAGYIFERTGASWTERVKLLSGSGVAQDFAGFEVALAGDHAILGAYAFDAPTSSADREGAVFHFERLSGGNWTERATLFAPDPADNGRFGYNVQWVGDDALYVSSGGSGNPAGSSEVYVYERNGSSFAYQGDLGQRPDFPGADDGTNVVGFGQWLVTSPIGENTVTLRSCEGFIRYCSPANPNSSGGPAAITATGSNSLGANDFGLACNSAGPNQFGYFIMSMNPGFVPNFSGSQGNLCIGSPFVRFNRPQFGEVLFTDATGSTQLSINNGNLPNGSTWSVGDSWYFQFWFRDNIPAFVSNTSDGVRVIFQP